MNNDLLVDSQTLGRGAIRRLAAKSGDRVECLRGTLWITQDGDLRDTILRPGESFDFERPGKALLSAFDDSRYLLLQACPQGAY